MKVKDTPYGLYIDLEPRDMGAVLERAFRDSTYQYFAQEGQVERAVYLRVLGPHARAEQQAAEGARP